MMSSKLRRQIEKDEDVIETIIGFLSNAVWCMRNNNKNDEEIARCLGTSTEMIETIKCDREIRRLAEIYILTHYELYEDDIILETRRLYTYELIDDENDFASGLYNMNELYLKAIDYAINKRKRKEC